MVESILVHSLKNKDNYNNWRKAERDRERIKFKNRQKKVLKKDRREDKM